MPGSIWHSNSLATPLPNMSWIRCTASLESFTRSPLPGPACRASRRSRKCSSRSASSRRSSTPLRLDDQAVHQPRLVVLNDIEHPVWHPGFNCRTSNMLFLSGGRDKYASRECETPCRLSAPPGRWAPLKPGHPGASIQSVKIRWHFEDRSKPACQPNTLRHADSFHRCSVLQSGSVHR
jgi:hypothetical protein